MSNEVLVFDCKQCGDCCVGFGGTLVDAKSICEIAAFLGIPEAKMRSDFCEVSGQGLVLSMGEEKRCIFQKNNVCTIHPVKPQMCREWPYIPAVLRQPGNWNLMGEACPGIDPEAPPEAVHFHTLKALQETRPGFTLET